MKNKSHLNSLNILNPSVSYNKCIDQPNSLFKRRNLLNKYINHEDEEEHHMQYKANYCKKKNIKNEVPIHTNLTNKIQSESDDKCM